MSIVFTLFLLYFGSLFASYDLSQKVSLRRFWNDSSEFQLEEEQDEIGYIRRNFFKKFREYLLFDKGEALLARAKLSFHRAYALFTVTTPAEEVIGFIEEGPNTIQLLDEKNELIATSSINRWHTEIVLLDNEGQPLGLLSRPFFRENDDWQLSITSPKEWNLHRILWTLLPAIHNDMQFWSTFHLYHEKEGMRR